MYQLNPDLCLTQFITYRLPGILRRPPIDWIIKFGASSFILFQKILVPEEWTEKLFLPQPITALVYGVPWGFIKHYVVLIIGIISICKSQALNTSTSLHFIFYLKLKNKQQQKKKNNTQRHLWLTSNSVLEKQNYALLFFFFFSIIKPQELDEGAFRCQQWGAVLWSWTAGDKC